MQKHFQRFLMFISLVASLGIAKWPGAISLASAAAETALTNGLPANVAEELRRFREEIEEQGRRIDRLYHALGPHLNELEAETARLKKQEEEDKLLAMERIADVSDQSLSGQGCANPATAEFAAITSGGAVQIFDAQGNPGKKLKQEGQIVTAVAFSPNGVELLAGTDAGALLVWDVAKGNCSTVSTNVGKGVGRVAWLGTNKLAWGRYVSYWEGGKPANHDKPAGAVLARDSGEVLWQFRSFIRNDFFTLAGTAGGQRLVVMEIPGQPRGAFLLRGTDGQVLLTCYDTESGHTPLSLGISPDGRILAVGYAPYDIILWDARTGEQLKLLKGHRNWVVSLAFSADSKRLISGAGDSTARVWNVDSAKEIGRLRFEGASTYVNSVGLSPRGDLAFALTQQGQFVVGRVPAGKP